VGWNGGEGVYGGFVKVYLTMWEYHRPGSDQMGIPEAQYTFCTAVGNDISHQSPE
jgi:hypothetical protein